MANTQIWHLVSRKLSGEASLDELRELEELLRQDPELAYKIHVYSQYFEHPSTELKRSAEKKQLSWERNLAKLREEFPGDFQENNEAQLSLPVETKKRKWLVPLLVILLAGGGIFFWKGYTDRNKDAQLAAEPQWKEMNTMPGTRSKTILPDGTTVWLNSDSKVTYNADFGKHKREITLTGEAFFDVAHNAEVPMNVKAGSVNIWVKGTAFNVKNYPGSGSVETSLIRGSVELTTDADPERKILLKPNEKITIEVKPTAGESTNNDSQAKINTGGLYQIVKLKQSSEANIIPEISWVENKLVFDNEVFTEIVKKMEIWYNIEIVVKNKSLGTKKFSGVFEKENISEALEALQLLNHFEFEVKGSKIIIK